MTHDYSLTVLLFLSCVVVIIFLFINTPDND